MILITLDNVYDCSVNAFDMKDKLKQNYEANCQREHYDMTRNVGDNMRKELKHKTEDVLYKIVG